MARKDEELEKPKAQALRLCGCLFVSGMRPLLLGALVVQCFRVRASTWGAEPSLHPVLSVGPAHSEPGEQDSAAGGHAVKPRLASGSTA
jgi:hypothetical protein